MTLMLFTSFIATLGLAAVHLFAGKLAFLMGKPRNVWLSASGGLSVAFVFLYLLPELAARQDDIEQSALQASLSFLDHHVYLLALTGMTTFYGLERIAKTTRNRHKRTQAENDQNERVFWAHLASFSIYNLVIGYMVVNEPTSVWSLALFVVAMALHFLVIDFSFREHYHNVYHDKGRWFLSGAVMTGWAAGIFIEIPDLAMNVATAFIAGGIILNALKEELPEERQSRFWPFLLGAALYSTVAVAHTGWA